MIANLHISPSYPIKSVASACRLPPVVHGDFSSCLGMYDQKDLWVIFSLIIYQQTCTFLNYIAFSAHPCAWFMERARFWSYRTYVIILRLWFWKVRSGSDLVWTSVSGDLITAGQRVGSCLTLTSLSTTCEWTCIVGNRLLFYTKKELNEYAELTKRSK